MREKETDGRSIVIFVTSFAAEKQDAKALVELI